MSWKTQWEGRNLVEQLDYLVNWLINSKLQDKLGTCRTRLRVIDSEIRILHSLATRDKIPSAIFTFKLPAKGEYIENKLWAPIIWLDAPESIIQGVIWNVVLNAVKKVPLWAKELENKVIEDWPEAWRLEKKNSYNFVRRSELNPTLEANWWFSVGVLFVWVSVEAWWLWALLGCMGFQSTGLPCKVQQVSLMWPVFLQCS